jgi:signal peptidase I
VVVFNPPLSAVPEEQSPGELVPRCGDGGPASPRSSVCSRPVDRRAEQTFIKRVVAGPGDRIRVLDGMPIVDGEPVRGSWETVPRGRGSGCNLPIEVTIPADHWFVMGDNRAGSDDSRFWGPVPRAWIIGHAFASYWPPSQLGGL